MPKKAQSKPKNANGKGSVYFEKERNKWRAIVTDTQGNRISARFNTKAEGNEWVTIKIAEMYKNEYIAPSDITVGEWYIEYVTTFCGPNVRRKTLAEYLRIGKKFEPIANIKLQKLTSVAVQKFYNSLPPMAPSSKYKIHTMLKSAITKAYTLGNIQKNIMLAVTAPPLGKTEIEIFTIEETQKILNTVQNSRYYSRYYTFILAALSTGARLGELLGLKLSEVHKGYIHIINNVTSISGKVIEEPPKTDAGIRNITIQTELEHMLRQEALSDKITPFNPYIFHTKNGTVIQPRNIERAWKQILIEAGIEHKKFHTLRHTHASQLLADGVPLLEVAKRLGHSDPTHTLKLYGHFIPGYDSKIPEQVTTTFRLKA